MGKKIRDPEAAAWDARLKAEGEEDDFDAFAAAYFRATGDHLSVLERPEPPDFLCERSDGSSVGVELTQLRRSPDDAHWAAVLGRQYEMDPYIAAEEFDRLLAQKASKLPNFSTRQNILVFLNCEADFTLLCSHLLEIPLEDFEHYSFTEVWLGDYQGLREGAHFSIRLAGLYPAHLRIVEDRLDRDQKPFG